MKLTYHELKEAQNNMIQTVCPRCGGLKQVKVYNNVIHPTKWSNYMIANDAGCICQPKKK